MKKIRLLYDKVFQWAKGNFILKYFVVQGLFTEAWYKTPIYRGLAAPVIFLKRRNVRSSLPFSEVSIAATIAFFGVIPPLWWRDWFVFAAFWTLSVLFILKTPNARDAVNCSIYLYVFILAAFLLPFDTAVMLLYLLAAGGIAFLIMHVIDEPPDIWKILAGTYIAVAARSVFVAVDTMFAGTLQSGVNFSEFLIMLFPFALAFVFIKRNKRRKIWLLAGLLPSLYAVVAVLFDIGDILQAQNFLIPQFEGEFLDYAMKFQGIYARAGTVGTAPFMEIYTQVYTALDTGNFGVRLLIYMGAFGVLLFLWYVIRLIRRAIVGIFRKRGDARGVLIAGICALLGVVIVAPFSINWLNVRTLFVYWIVIGIVGGVVRNRVSE